MATDNERDWGIMALLVIGSLAISAFGDTLSSIIGGWPTFIKCFVIIPIGWGVWMLFVWLVSLIDRE